MPYVLFALSAVGFVFLIICIYMLVAPFVGWSHRHSVSAKQIAQMTVEILKPGRYSISIRRDRFWLFKGQGSASDVFPKVSFFITKPSTGEAISYFPALSLFTTTGTGKITIRVGYFDVLDPGQYLIISQPGSKFLQNEEIIIRKFVSTAKKVLSIVGIVISAQIFIFGLVLGVLSLTGNI